MSASARGERRRSRVEERTYLVYGLVLRSALPLSAHLGDPPDRPRGAVGGEVRVEVSSSPPFLTPDDAEPVWTGPPTGSRAETASLLRIGDLEVLRFSGVGDFRLGRDRIEVRRADGASADLVELRLLGPVLAFWLERSGLLALHGAAVGVGGQAVVLLGSRGTGKTSLAAELVRRGHPLLSDDLAPLELREAEGERSPLRVRSGYPQLRVWPDLAARLGADPERLAPVLPGHPKRRLPVGERGFGAFCGRSLPLGGIYLLERRDDLPAGGAEVRPLPANRALVELVRHSFSPRLVAAAGLDEARLERLAVAVRSAGVRRLVYPSGFDRLGEALDALRADLG